MKRTTIHPELERKIDLYVNGQLNDQQIDDLWADLIRDSEAIDYLKTVAGIKQISLDKERRKRAGGASGGTMIRQGWIYAAAAMLLIAGILFLMRPGMENAPLEPITSIELDYYRSTGGAADPSGEEEVIREAIVLANEGKPMEAIKLIEEALNRTEDQDSRAHLFINAGSILYNTSMFHEAATLFEQVVEIEESEPLIRERAYWYLGNTYFQLNNVRQAREAFQNAYNLDGAYSRIARSYLSALSGK